MIMQTAGMTDTHTKELEKHGLTHLAQVHWNVPTATLFKEIAWRRDGWIAQHDPVIVNTGEHTGRSPKDKFIVQEPSCADQFWWGQINQPMAPEHFERLKQRLFAYLQGKELFVQDCYASADPAYRIGLRVITEKAWHSLFARDLFITTPMHAAETYVPAAYTPPGRKSASCGAHGLWKSRRSMHDGARREKAV
jgi:phosphoenolpyruvate carboxykinase (ATP)